MILTHGGERRDNSPTELRQGLVGLAATGSFAAGRSTGRSFPATKVELNIEIAVIEASREDQALCRETVHVESHGSCPMAGSGHSG